MPNTFMIRVSLSMLVSGRHAPPLLLIGLHQHLVGEPEFTSADTRAMSGGNSAGAASVGQGQKAQAWRQFGERGCARVDGWQSHSPFAKAGHVGVVGRGPQPTDSMVATTVQKL